MTFTARKNSSSIPITPVTKTDFEKQKNPAADTKNEWFEKPIVKGALRLPGEITMCFTAFALHS